MTGLARPFPDELVEAVAQRTAELLAERLTVRGQSSLWVDYQGAAEHLGCAPKRIRNLTSQRRIPHHREGGRVIYHKGELDAWVLDGSAAL
jgi:hypothetical protein